MRVVDEFYDANIKKGLKKLTRKTNVSLVNHVLIPANIKLHQF
jgi:hypothetical protein